MWIVHNGLKDGGRGGGEGGGGAEESSWRRESFEGSKAPPHLLLSERDEFWLILSRFFIYIFHPSLAGSSPSASVHPYRQLIHEYLNFIHLHSFHLFLFFHPSLGLVFLFCSFIHTVDL
jgi:hypothetical protein